MSAFEDRLKGGHPNSLGETVIIVEEVLAHPNRFEELFNCYFILTIKWFATANLLNVSIYAGKWLAPMSQTTSYCV
jgi:hypothetical protein